MNTAIKNVKQLSVIRTQLDNNSVELVLTDAVQDFLELKSQMEGELQATWKALESYMLDHDIKNLCNLTIATKTTWETDTTVLPAKFFKKVPDTKKLGLYFTLNQKCAKGVTRKVTKYLTKTNRKTAKVA